MFEWILPQFGNDDNETTYAWQAARMQNYMTKKVVEDGWTPKSYQYEDTIQPDHVARFYGTSLMAKILMGNQSVNQIFCSREYFNEVLPIQASMPKNEPKDSTSCLYYSDNCDPKKNDNWDDKVVAPPSTASHRLKHG